jgi:hypothetical protein
MTTKTDEEILKIYKKMLEDGRKSVPREKYHREWERLEDAAAIRLWRMAEANKPICRSSFIYDKGGCPNEPVACIECNHATVEYRIAEARASAKPAQSEEFLDWIDNEDIRNSKDQDFSTWSANVLWLIKEVRKKYLATHVEAKPSEEREKCDIRSIAVDKTPKWKCITHNCVWLGEKASECFNSPIVKPLVFSPETVEKVALKLAQEYFEGDGADDITAREQAQRNVHDDKKDIWLKEARFLLQSCGFRECSCTPVPPTATQLAVKSEEEIRRDEQQRYNNLAKKLSAATTDELLDGEHTKNEAIASWLESEEAAVMFGRDIGDDTSIRTLTLRVAAKLRQSNSSASSPSPSDLAMREKERGSD